MESAGFENENYGNRVKALRARASWMASELANIMTDGTVRLAAGQQEQLAGMRQQCENAATRTAVYSICVLGSITAGKTTLLNTLLTGEMSEFLPKGGRMGNPTTAAPTRVRHRSGPGFQATIKFKSVASIKKLLDDHAAAASEGASKSSPEWKARAKVLQKLFKRALSYEIPKELELEPLATKVGALPEILRAESARELGLELRQFLQLSDEDADEESMSLALVVDHVLVEGPFKHLPPGVELWDLPGLGDANEARSQRALDEFELADEVWLVMQASGALTNESGKKQLQMLLDSVQLQRVCIAGTKSAQIVEAGQDAVVAEAKCRVQIEKKAKSIALEWVMDHRVPQSDEPATEEERRRADNLLERVKQIYFTELEADQRRGLAQWHELLGERQRQQVLRLEEAERMLEDVFVWAGGLGKMQPRTDLPLAELERWTSGLCRRVEELAQWLAGRTSGRTAELQAQVQRIGEWAEINGNTWNALYRPHHRGCIRRQGARPKLININADIATVHAGQIVSGMVQVLREGVEGACGELEQLVCRWDAGLADWVRSVVQQLKHEAEAVLRACCNVNSVALEVVNMLDQMELFYDAIGRQQPSRHELSRVFSLLDARTAPLLRALADRIRMVGGSFQNRVAPLDLLDEATRQGLIARVRMARSLDGAVDEEGVPEEFLCPILQDVMAEPTIFLCCGCRFDAQVLLRHRICPYCRVVPATLPDAALRERIRRFEEEKKPGKVDAGLWLDAVRNNPRPRTSEG